MPAITGTFYHNNVAITTNVKRSTSNDEIYTNVELPLEGPDSSNQVVESGMLLATGSADPFVYIYSLGASEV
jgi:hypothetical protein